MQILRQVTLDERHHDTGKVRHFANSLITTTAILQIVMFDEGEYNLLHLDSDENELTDTFHETVEDALTQAELEYRVKPEHWTILKDDAN